jgi:hypothetical protein
VSGEVGAEGTTAVEEMDSQDWADDGDVEDLSNLELFATDTAADDEVAVDDVSTADESVENGQHAAATDAESYTIKVNGEERTVTHDELINLAQQGDDYTRKTQALADERQRYAAYDNLERALESNPLEALKLLADTYNVELGADNQEQGTPPEFQDPLEAEVNSLRAWRQEQEAVARQSAVENELAALKTTYNDPNFDDLAVLQFAVQNNIPSLEVAYKAMRYDAPQAAAVETDAETTAAQKVDQKRNLPPVEGGAKRPKAATAPGGSAKPSLRDAFRMAVGA